MSEEMSIKQQKKNWIHLAGCDWSKLDGEDWAMLLRRQPRFAEKGK